jgi:hypothetical protein
VKEEKVEGEKEAKRVKLESANELSARVFVV